MWASLRLDGELSAFESLLLDAHLAGCGTCDDFATGIGLVTQGLREVGPELPERPLTLPGRSRSAHGLLRPAVTAATMVAALAAAVLPFRSSPVEQLPAAFNQVAVAGNGDLVELRKLSQAQQRPAVLVLNRRSRQVVR